MTENCLRLSDANLSTLTVTYSEYSSVCEDTDTDGAYSQDGDEWLRCDAADSETTDNFTIMRM